MEHTCLLFNIPCINKLWSLPPISTPANQTLSFRVHQKLKTNIMQTKRITKLIVYTCLSSQKLGFVIDHFVWFCYLLKCATFDSWSAWNTELFMIKYINRSFEAFSSFFHTDCTLLRACMAVIWIYENAVLDFPSIFLQQTMISTITGLTLLLSQNPTWKIIN